MNKFTIKTTTSGNMMCAVDMAALTIANKEYNLPCYIDDKEVIANQFERGYYPTNVCATIKDNCNGRVWIVMQVWIVVQVSDHVYNVYDV